MPALTKRAVKAGQIFNLWKLLEADLNHAGKEPHWRARCECGTVKSVSLRNIIEGRSKGCGCTKGAIMIQNSKRHIKMLTKIREVYGKTCTHCAEVKDLDQFNLDSTAGDKKFHICRACTIKIQRERRAANKQPPKPNAKRLEIKEGAQFNSLTVLKEAAKIGVKRAFLCQCACGKEVHVTLNSLRRGDVKACSRWCKSQC